MPAFERVCPTAPVSSTGRYRSAVLVGHGGSLGEAIRSIGVTDPTYYRWCKEYGGLKMDQAKRLKELERENTRLRKAVADLTLDKQVLAEVAKGNW